MFDLEMGLHVGLSLFTSLALSTSAISPSLQLFVSNFSPTAAVITDLHLSKTLKLSRKKFLNCCNNNFSSSASYNYAKFAARKLLTLFTFANNYYVFYATYLRATMLSASELHEQCSLGL